MEIEDLRWRLFGALASSLAAGCGPAVGLPDGESESASRGDDDDAASSGADGQHTHGITSDNTDTTTTTSGMSGITVSGGDDDDGVEDGSPKFDLHIVDAPLIECLDQPPAPPETCAAELPSEFAHYRFFCVEPELGDCESWAAQFDEEYGKGAWSSECLDADDCSAEVLREIGCGPLPEYVDQCCFWFVAEWTQTCPGRPFVIAGRERVADPTARADWAEGRVEPDALAPELRRALADAWSQQALFEHASIASFSRFTLHLLACGAPADLVAAASVALGEETRHAQLFFGFASRYAGAPIGPTALDVRDSLTPSSLAFAEIVLSAVREGCIAETISAWHVALAARGTSDPAMARTLDEVATQELEHAVLAWRFLDWAWTHADDELRGRIVETFAHAESSAPRRASTATSLPDATMLTHGILPAELHASATRQALRDVVAPAARRFIATRQRSGSHSSSSVVLASTSATPMRT